MKVIELENTQPEFKTPIWDYMAGLVDDERVADGKKAMAEHAAALKLAESKFGVDRHVIAAIWGVEFEFRRVDGRPSAGARRSPRSPASLRAVPTSIKRRTDRDAEDRRPRRRAARRN